MEKQKTAPTSDFKGSLKSLEDTLDLYFGQKAPAMPTNIKELIVNLAPWLTLILGLLSLPAILFVFGLGTLLAPFSFLGGVRAGFNYGLSMIVLAVSVVLEFLSIPGLFKRSRQGWNFVYYSALVNALYNIVSFNLGGLIIGALISFYVLFQVREYYK
jgi:hypothetical protein